MLGEKPHGDTFPRARNIRYTCYTQMTKKLNEHEFHRRIFSCLLKRPLQCEDCRGRNPELDRGAFLPEINLTFI